jgi:flagellar FliJ protein
MSKRRKQRISLLLDQRQKALDERVTELARTKLALEAAHEQVHRCQAAIGRAEQERQEAGARGVSTQEWIDVNQWLDAARKAQLEAKRHVESSQRAIETAQGNVLGARSAVKQIESLATRERQHEAILERRDEQRASDEHTANALVRNGNLE